MVLNLQLMDFWKQQPFNGAMDLAGKVFATQHNREMFDMLAAKVQVVKHQNEGPGL